MRKNNHKGEEFIKTIEKLIILLLFCSTGICGESELIPVKLPGKCGYINKTGQFVIPPKFDMTSDFCNKTAWVRTGAVWRNASQDDLPYLLPISGYIGGKYGFIDRAGNYILEPQFDKVWPFSEGMARVNIGGYWSKGHEYANYADNKFVRGNWGFVNNEGKIIIPLQFEEAMDFKNGLAGIKKDGRWGFIDKNGNIVIKPQFDEVGGFLEKVAPVSARGKWGLIDRSGGFFISPRYDEMYEFKEGLIRVKKNDKYGCFNGVGKTVIPILYKEIGPFSEGMAVISRKKKIILPFKIWHEKYRYEGAGLVTDVILSGYIDTKGKIVIKPRYWNPSGFFNGVAHATTIEGKIVSFDKSGRVINPENLERQSEIKREFHEGLAVMGKGYDYEGSYGGDRYGFIDDTGKMIIDARFVKAGNFSGGLAWAQTDWKMGYKGQDGKILIEPQFDEAQKFINGLAKVIINKKHGLIDKSGEYIVKPIYDFIGEFVDGVSCVGIKKDHYIYKYGYIDKTGKVIIEIKFHKPLVFFEGLAVANVDEGVGYVDKTGMWAIPPKDFYATTRNFSEGLAVAENENGIGYIDKTGEWVILPQKFLSAGDFSEGLAHIELFTDKNRFIKKIGFIDKTGQFVIQPQFDGASKFSNGVACVIVNYKYGIIDKNGSYIVEPKYNEIKFPPKEGMVKAHVMKYGFINIEQKIIIEPQFNEAHDFSEGLATVSITKDNSQKWGYIDKTGKFIIEPQFESAGDFKNGYAKVMLKGWVDALIDKTGKVYDSIDLKSKNMPDGI